MKKIHANCTHPRRSCCRFGGRRRLCLLCHKTFRIRKFKRGRKQKRTNGTLVRRYFERTLLGSAGRAKIRKGAADKFERALLKSRDWFICRAKYKQPGSGPIILIADALIEHIDGKWYTGYLRLIRRVNGEDAVILPMVWLPGKETIQGWNTSLDLLPSSLRGRIKALVCDGHCGLLFYAKWKGWLVQRCQFHLIASIQGRRSRGKFGRHRQEGERLMKLVNEVLSVKDKEKIPGLLSLLEAGAWDTKSIQLRKILLGFVNHFEQYRTCLDHPELNLPSTSNSAESCIGLIEELRKRGRGFRTIQSLVKWTDALLKFRRQIKCRKYQPN